MSPDPITFVAEAEAASNAYDLDALTAVYAEDARLEVVIDGALEVHCGRAEITEAWAGFAQAMRRAGLRLRKQLLAADGAVICNTWRGHTRRGTDARGMEMWSLGDTGQVQEHWMWQFLDVRDARTVRAQLRLALTPTLAFDLLRGRRTAALAHALDHDRTTTRRHHGL